MRKTKYVTVLDWMYELDLRNLRELFCYAIIYGYSQDGRSEFYATASYVSKLMKCTDRTTFTTLNELAGRKLLSKRIALKNGVKECFYQAVIPEGD